MKRFWDTATVEPLGDGYGVRLDGKPVRLPGGAHLRITGETLARAIAAEWQHAGGAPGGEMSYADVPLTGLAGTVQERIAPDPGPTVQALAAYAASDLLCYRAEHRALAARQDRLWQPWLDWSAATFSAPLLVTTGVMPVAQSPEALRRLADAVATLTPAMLGGLGLLVPGLGSLVLGLAVVHGRLAAAAAHALSCVDETFQAEAWGEDEAAAGRRRAIAADIVLAERFVMLSREEDPGWRPSGS